MNIMAGVFSTAYMKKLQEAGRTRSVAAVQAKLQEDYDTRLEKQLSMLENVGEPQVEFTRFMQYYENFVFSSLQFSDKKDEGIS